MIENNNDMGLEKDGTLTSESLAELIIDELVVSKLIKEENFDEAVKIATLEIEIRKTAGDY